MREDCENTLNAPERTQKIKEISDIIVMVTDGSLKSAGGLEKYKLEFEKKKCVVVINKIDIKNDETQKKIRKVFSNMPCVETSALKGRGLSELKKEILNCAEGDLPELSGTPFITNTRHIHHLESARSHLKNAVAAALEKKSEETLSIDIRACLKELGAITGDSVEEDVLSAIFNQFCIGK